MPSILIPNTNRPADVAATEEPAAFQPAAEASGIRFKAGWITLLVALACLGSLFFRLDAYPLQNPDEGRYTEAAREMLERHDLVVPHFAYVPRLNKPPFAYWVTAACFQLLGVNAGAARFGSALAALLVVGCVFALAKGMWGTPAGFAASLVLLTSLGFAALARTVVTDIWLCLFLTAAVASGWWLISTRRPAAYLAFAASCALATLTKGPVGVALPGLILLLYLAVTRQWRTLRWPWVAGAALFYALIAFPWFAAVQARYPHFLSYLLVGENLERFQGRFHSQEPFYFYIPLLLGGLSVWSPAFLQALWRTARAPRLSDPEFSPVVYAWLWFGVPFLFFSLSKAKLPTYVLPCFPAAALVVGKDWAASLTLHRQPQSGGNNRGLLFTIGGALLLAAVALAVVAARGVRALTPEETNYIAVWMGGALAVGGVACLAAAIRGKGPVPFLALALAGLLLLQGGVSTAQVVLGTSDARPFAEYVARHAQPGDAVLTFQADRFTTFRFYLGQLQGTSRQVRDIPPLRRPDEAEAEAADSQSARRVTRAAVRELMETLRHSPRAFLVLRRRDLKRLQTDLSLVHCSQVAVSNREWVLVTNTPLPAPAP